MDGARQIGNWRVVDEAGEGGVGRVFVVRKDDSPNRLFVLKLCRDDIRPIPRKAICHEIERLAKPPAPAHMPRLVEHGVWHRLPFFVMERIEPIDYPISSKTYRAFCVAAFEALAALHAADLIHGDITPRHLDWKNGRIAFIDFDNAFTREEAVINENCVGTAPYIAPEVASRGEISDQSDMYALAMILIERCPDKQRDCFEPVLRECLRHEPKERPRSAADFAERLRTCRPPHHRFKVVVKWTAIVVGSTCLGLLAVNTGLYFYRRAATERKYGKWIEANVHLRSGLIFLQRGDPANAVRHLRQSERNGSEEARANLKEIGASD